MMQSKNKENSSLRDNCSGSMSNSKTTQSKVDKSLTSVDFEGTEKFLHAKTTCQKIFWIFMLSLGLVIAIFEIAYTIIDYRNSPVITAYRIVSKSTMEFPQIYMCPSNKIRNSYLQANRSELERVEKMAAKLFLDYKFNGKNVNYRRPALNEDFKTDLNKTTFEYFKQIYMDMSIPQSTFFVLCQFTSNFLNQPQCSTLVTPVVDLEHGRCYVIDVGKFEQMIPAQGLTIFVNTKTQDYPLDADLQPKFDGISVSIGKRFDPITVSETLLVPQFTYAKVSMTAQRTKTESISTGNARRLCNEADDFKFIILNVTYSVAACRKECYFQNVFDKCRCVMPMDQMFVNRTLLNISKYCSLDDVVNCVEPDVVYSEVGQSSIAQCSTECHAPCESWRFDAIVSSMPLLEESFGKVVMPPNTTPYDISTVQFAFPVLEYEEFIEEGNSISFTDMVGNIGGQAGLWLGISVVGLIKIPLAVCTMCYSNTCKLMTKFQTKKVQPISS